VELVGTTKEKNLQTLINQREKKGKEKRYYFQGTPVIHW